MRFDPAPLSWLAGVISFASVALGCATSTPMQYPLSATQFALAAPATLVSPPAQDGSTSEVRSVFAEWVSARSHGDRATYEGLYDAKRFEGVHRTRTGLEKRLTWSDWQADQRSTMDRGEAPLVVGPVFESWPGGTLDLATASVAFDEESVSSGAPTREPHSVDLVQRVLVFGRGTDGKLRIVREEVGAPGSAPARSPLGMRSNTLSRDAKVARALEN